MDIMELFTLIQASDYGRQFQMLLESASPMPLDAGSPHTSVKDELSALSVEEAFSPRTLKDAAMGMAALAGVWLLHNFLEASHRISQNLLTSTGSYWHGIVHRRETDFWNSKYWFRKIDAHPVYDPLKREVKKFVDPLPMAPEIRFLKEDAPWDPLKFVDFCEQALANGSKHYLLAQRIQLVEWELLFDFCYRKAVGA